MPASGVLGGLLAAAVVAVIEGLPDYSGLRKVGVADLADGIRVKLAGALVKKLSLRVVDVQVADGQNDMQYIVDDSQADVILDVRTTKWEVSKAPLGGLAVSYEGEMRLTDRRTKKVLAAGACEVNQAKGSSIEDLTRNHGEDLREEVRAVMDYCADDFRTRVLGL